MAEPKTFNLKGSETNYLRIQQNALLSTFLSFVAGERLGIQVTANTRFELNPEMTEVVIHEKPAQAEEPGVVTEAPKGKK